MSRLIHPRYDIIVSGGGIVGFTLLNLLSKSHYLNRASVLLLETTKKPANLKQSPRVHPTSSSEQNDHHSEVKFFSNRVSSITNSSRDLFSRLGVWNSISEYVKPVKQIKVWNYNFSNKILFDCSESSTNIHVEDSAFTVVENNRLSLALLDQHLKLKDATKTIAWQCNLEGLSQSMEPGLIDVSYVDQTTGKSCTASAPLVLGCDGYNSKVRTLTNMKLLERELGKVAVVGTVKLDQVDGRNETAYQRFSASRQTVAALLPVDSEYSSFVISAPTDYAQYLTDCSDESFIDEFNLLISSSEAPRGNILSLTHQVSDLLFNALHFITTPLTRQVSTSSGDFEEHPRVIEVVEKSRASFPLKNSMTLSAMVTKVPGERHLQIALLGDSAHRVHPLAGQGLNMGIHDCESLVRQLEEYGKCGERVFNEYDLSILSKALENYDKERRLVVATMIAGISQMENLFQLTPPQAISAFNKMQPFKALLMKVANGC